MQKESLIIKKDERFHNYSIVVCCRASPRKNHQVKIHPSEMDHQKLICKLLPGSAHCILFEFYAKTAI